MWTSIWHFLYFAFYRPLYKWILHRWTNQCELLRITNAPDPHEDQWAVRTLAVESSLRRSRCPELRRVLTADDVDVDDTVDIIMKIKSISITEHPGFRAKLRIILSQICGFRQLKAEVESIRKVPYSSDNPTHEAMLMDIWKALKPDEPLQSRISRQWTEIGFQGDDPMTDFRGMGHLGLQNLHFLCTEQTLKARKLLSHSHHPKFGYSFGIVSINITSLTLDLLKEHHHNLRTHFYNTVHAPPKVIHFHHVYSYLLTEFDKFWFDEEPRDIMEFNRVRNKFKKSLLHRLKCKTTMLGTRIATYM